MKPPIETSDTPAATAGLSANPQLAAVLAWIFPGAGHLYLGRRKRALAFCLLVAAMLAIGAYLHGNLYRVLPGQPLSVLATLGCMGLGLPYFLLRFLAGYEGDLVARGFEYGTAFILTAGLMNWLLVLDALDIARGRKD